jgi:hypoxanthine phosphoribosyltransferase
MSERVTELYLTSDFIQSQVRRLAQDIAREYDHDAPITVIGILDGCYHFISDLTRELVFDHNLHFIKLKSYKNNTEHSTPEWIIAPDPSLIHDHHVIILDTIIDSGETFDIVVDNILKHGPFSVEGACLIQRAGNSAWRMYAPKWIGILYEGPEFFYGYGLDNNGRSRHLKDIRIIIQ